VPRQLRFSILSSFANDGIWFYVYGVYGLCTRGKIRLLPHEGIHVCRGWICNSIRNESCTVVTAEICVFMASVNSDCTSLITIYVLGLDYATAMSQKYNSRGWQGIAVHTSMDWFRCFSACADLFLHENVVPDLELRSQHVF
jgi:hypothetical protein